MDSSLRDTVHTLHTACSGEALACASFRGERNVPLVTVQVASKSRGDLRQRVTTYSSTPAARCDASKSKLTYPEFLDALVVLGDRMYRKVALTPGKKSAGRRASALAGGPGDRSAESAFQQVPSPVCSLLLTYTNGRVGNLRVQGRSATSR